MKYKLINKQTNQEHICDKVTIDGFNYYVSDENISEPCYFYNKPTNYFGKALKKEGKFWICENIEGFHLLSIAKKVIATDNPNIDIPKVDDDELSIIVNSHFKDYWKKEDGSEMKGNEISSEMMTNMLCETSAFIAGYNSSQEIHPFTEEDMIEFAEWFSVEKFADSTKSYKELLQIWKEQQSKIIYYGAD